jgi:hypothetical protein
VREFDLNIERVLENWTVAHALREVIANALDEAALTGTAEPLITEDGAGRWHIRDSGRGLRYEHLTQNESVEKLNHPDRVVGKFGVGLKDALATFDRHGVDVLIRSRHGDITTGVHAKHGFDDVQTLHALIYGASDPAMTGTEFVLSGSELSAEQIDEAKSLFLHYAGDEVVDTTPVGSVLSPVGGESRIYVNGLRVATEDNFLFSYNITSPTAALRRALNRERSHVGRGAYTDRVKAILVGSESDRVIEELVADLQRFEVGDQHDETAWLDIGLHACRQLNSRRSVIFLSPSELGTASDFLGRARDDGYQVVVVPDSIRRKLPNLVDASGSPMRDLDQYRQEWTDSFQFTWVEPADLTPNELIVWNNLARIFDARGGRPTVVRDVRVSETMRLMQGSFREAVGLWEASERRIIIKRDQLASIERFAGTILHEAAHAVSNAPDVSIEFEEALTGEIGSLVARQLGSAAT